MSEHPGERAPQPGVREGVVRQAVGADHRVLETQDAPQILLVHLEIDPAGGTQPLDRFLDAATPLRADGLEVASLQLRVRYRQVTITRSAPAIQSASSTVELAT